MVHLHILSVLDELPKRAISRPSQVFAFTLDPPRSSLTVHSHIQVSIDSMVFFIVTIAYFYTTIFLR